MSQDQSIEGELIDLQNRWMEAVRKQDRATLESILGEEYVHLSISGMLDRASWLEDALSPFHIDSFHYDDFRIHIYGDTAVVTSHYTHQTELDGENLSFAFVLTDVWVRRAGRWQVVNRHSSRIGD